MRLNFQVALYSQTTKRTKNLYALKAELETRGGSRFQRHPLQGGFNRDIQLREFARQHDKIVFVSAENHRTAKCCLTCAKTITPKLIW